MNRLYLTIIAVLLCALIFTMVVNNNRAKGAGAQYEYRILRMFGNQQVTEDQVNEMAGDGWRLVAASENILAFERALK
jgi:hypothetical protein